MHLHHTLTVEKYPDYRKFLSHQLRKLRESVEQTSFIGYEYVFIGFEHVFIVYEHRFIDYEQSFVSRSVNFLQAIGQVFPTENTSISYSAATNARKIIMRNEVKSFSTSLPFIKKGLYLQLTLKDKGERLIPTTCKDT